MKLPRWNVLFVAGLTAGAILWLVVLERRASAYTTPYRQPGAERREMGAPLPALVSRVVFVIVDGLRYDLSEGMACLQQLRQAGASAVSIIALPSVSQPSWTTLVSGARPEINGAALANADFAEIKPIAVDHIFQLAKQARLKTALAGADWWQKMTPPAYLDRSHFVGSFDAAGDREATQAALRFLADPGLPEVLLLYLGEYDEVSHHEGALSPAALQAAARINDHLCALLAAVDLRQTVVIVTADHGELDRGGHGGDDPVVVQAPLALAGPRVRPGEYPAVQEPDIAMTIAALLGMPLPRSGQGRILYEMLDVSEAELARGEAASARQQLAQAGAYLAGPGLPPPPAEIARQVAELDARLARGEFGEAARRARALREQINDHVQRERSAEIRRSRLRRLPLALLGAGLIAALLALNWRAGERAALTISAVGVLAWHAFYLARGHVYSLSTLGSVGELPRLGWTLVTGAVSALALCLLLAWLLARAGGASRARPALTAAGVSALGVGLVGLPFLLALVAYAGGGSLGGWELIVPRLSFLLLLGLAQAALMGVLALIVLAPLVTSQLTREHRREQRRTL